MPLPLGAILFAMSTRQQRSIDECFKQDTIHTATIPWLQSREISTPLTLGTILFVMSTRQQQSIDQCLTQDMIHTATIQRTINASTTGCDLVYYVNLIIAISRSCQNSRQRQPGNSNQFACFKKNQNYFQHCNQSEVAVSTKVNVFS